MAMVGDAISHSVLPGIVIAFFISGSLSSWTVMIGATTLGILTTFIIEFLQKRGGVQADAAIGLTFTFLFAVGVILIAANSGNLHIDQDCVLHGEIAYIPLDTGTVIQGIEIPRQPMILGVLFLAVVSFLLIGYRGLFLTTFDPEYSDAIGMQTSVWHYLLMAAVSLATVVSFESVGAILVVAFLIVPAATAYLVTDHLPSMLILSCVFGVLASASGYYLAVFLDGSIAGAISTMMGVFFFLVFFFAPRYGFIARRMAGS